MTMSCKATHPRAAALAELIEHHLAAGLGHVRIERELIAEHGHIPRAVMAAAFELEARARWRREHPIEAQEKDADRT
jgi:hypothetical protein